MRSIIKFCLLLVALFTPLLAYGDSVAPPRSYATPSSDGKFVFVMIAPTEAERDGIYLRDEDKRETQKVRAKYPASGMYLNDDSTTPLWTVDWYSYSVLVVSDGIHLVRRGPWASNLSDEALTFFANGKELRSHKVGDLVDTKMFLFQTVSHYMWEDSMNLDENRRTLSVATLSKERYVFDYTTGEIISASRPIRAIVVAGVAILTFSALLIIKRRRMVAEGAV
ncbi:MAG TPA: hypothetical protein VGW12_08440 [Pyrinomonadaceae bacterium]|nr:hypothetical protein [Pyrinomonadaceae bacterium]